MHFYIYRFCSVQDNYDDPSVGLNMKPLPLARIFITFLAFVSSSAIASRGPTYDVIRTGAKPDGRSDSTNGFMAAWKLACGSRLASTIYVPKGRYVLRKIMLIGPCNNRAIKMRIDGTLVAPPDYWVVGNSNFWLGFENVVGVSIIGGTIDAQGMALWNCKAAHRNCPRGATSLLVTNSKYMVINGLTSIDSQLFHIEIHQSRHMMIKGAKILASDASQNTDGIHVDMSQGVRIMNSDIKTGDDCISIGPGSRRVQIENIKCGPGHGISIGSLGQQLNEPGVQDVTVKNVKFTSTENGLRIKSWGRPSKGFVKNILYQDVEMNNVQNPIIIDQYYCPYNQCPHQDSGIKISNVRYENIHGTSATKTAVKLFCSKAKPCTGIQLLNVKLTFRNRLAYSSCKSSYGRTFGSIQPPSCLYRPQGGKKLKRGRGAHKKGGREKLILLI